MKITVLSENTTKGPQVTPEFGLSLYIECGSQVVLFDAGMSDNFARNAQKLGIDLAKVDVAVLSHGHFDHANGFKAFLEVNDHAPIYAHDGFDGDYYRAPREYIGVAPELKGNERFVSAQGRLEIAEGLTLLSYGNDEPLYPIASENLLMASGDAEAPDAFTHEQYLLACDGDVRLLVTGCAHRGIANIMHWTKDEHVTHVAGGFHLIGTNPEEYGKLDVLSEELLSYNADYFTCHCTGIEPYARLKECMGDRIAYVSTGMSLQL